MSSNKFTLVISPQAAEDFADILQYTFETYGKDQLYIYRDIIDKALLNISDNPKIAPVRKEISPNHRIFPAGNHLIVYRIIDRTICVSRISHKRMDIIRQI
ncbi:MAG: type II toxin-antitoxin system RelE/ParE family toxin [Pseudomonadota bacterium]